MKNTLRGVSGVALVLGLASLQSAFAQQAGQTVTTNQQTNQAQAGQTTGADQITPAGESSSTDRVVVIGSLIATAPENSAKPVDVFTAEDLQNRGSPSVSEFVRSLTGSAPSDMFGQSNPAVASGSGFANADLRGQGPSGTLLLMNGRRLATTNGGFGADLNTIPVEALQAVEVLKDGASTTYGAGAVGGVINFRTRRDIDAPQITIERNMYEGGEGGYKVDFMTGWVGDASNLLVSLSHFHEEPMMQTKRDYASAPFDVNPALWSTVAGSTQFLVNGNPGRFQPSANFLTAASTTTISPTINDLPGSVGPAARAACEGLGGQIGNVQQPNANLGSAAIPDTSCRFPQYAFQNLVDDTTISRAFAEFNADLTDTMEFHIDATYSKTETVINRIPSDSPLVAGVRATDSAVSALSCASSCFYVIPVEVMTYTDPGTTTSGTPIAGSGTRNPFIDDFIARTGTTALPATSALYASSAWRPFVAGGNPYFDNGLRQEKSQRERLMFNAGVKGEFQSEGMLSFLNGISYDYAAQYNQYLWTSQEPNYFVSRIQNALLGYGGRDCKAIDQVATDFSTAAAFNRTIGIQSDTAPGTNGCQWLNPFASAYATGIVTGQPNPMFPNTLPVLGPNATPRPSGYENPVDLIDWLTGDRINENNLTSSTFDATWSGALPDSIQLPGGEIGWAAGMQWRMVESRDTPIADDSDEEALQMSYCPFPDRSVEESPASPVATQGGRGCNGAGPFFHGGRLSPDYGDSQTLSYYAEFQLPITDRFNVSTSIRREEYNGGKVVGDIYSVAGKYDLTDNLYLRASYGTNFRMESALDFNPGEQFFSTVSTSTRFGTGTEAASIRTIANDLEPEEDATMSFGVGYNANIGDARVRATVGYWAIERTNEITTTTTTPILNAVFGQANAGAGAAQTVLDVGGGQCHPLSAFLVFSSGACVGGVTSSADLQDILLFTQNGPGFNTSGVDFEFDFVHPFFSGDLGVNLTATQNLEYERTAYDIAGVQFAGDADCLGLANFSTRNAGCGSFPEIKANATVSWRNSAHNVSLRANFTSGIYNEIWDAPTGVFTPIALSTVAGVPHTYSTYGVFADDHIEYDFNYIYSAPFWQDLDLRLTILNVFDEDPMAAQGRTGYYPGIGNPRGRQVEVGVTKKF